MTSNIAALRFAGLTARDVAPAKLVTIRDLQPNHQGWCRRSAVVIDSGEKFRLNPDANVSLARTVDYNLLVHRDWRGRYTFTGDFVRASCGTYAYPPSDWPVAKYNGNG